VQSMSTQRVTPVPLPESSLEVEWFKGFGMAFVAMMLGVLVANVVRDYHIRRQREADANEDRDALAVENNQLRKELYVLKTVTEASEE
jgi:hypothetical protein